MDFESWRYKLLFSSVLNNIVEQIEQVQEGLPQKGFGSTPEKTVFKWKPVKIGDKETVEQYWVNFKRNTIQARFEIIHNFGAFTDLFQIENNVDETFGQFMNKQLEKFNENDKVSVNIDHEKLIGKHLFIPPFQKKDFNKECFFNALYEVAQSNSSFFT